MSHEISREEVENLIRTRGPSLLLEILPPEYYEREHLPGAKNLPLSGFDLAATTLLPDRDAPIVTYCSGPTCANSHIAARRLLELGYTNVRVFTGGKSAWREAGLAFEAGAERVARVA
jgi:rhodanese-related sulfurtransferase